MQLNEKKYILTFSPLFHGAYRIISAIFLKLTQLLRIFILKNSNNYGILSNPTIVYSFKHDKNSKREKLFLNKELNTATVYINGSNHNLVYAASAYRLHPGPTLYTRHSIWRTTPGGN